MKVWFVYVAFRATCDISEYFLLDDCRGFSNFSTIWIVGLNALHSMLEISLRKISRLDEKFLEPVPGWTKCEYSDSRHQSFGSCSMRALTRAFPFRESCSPASRAINAKLAIAPKIAGRLVIRDGQNRSGWSVKDSALSPMN